jgi:hypothetical protein
MAVKITDKRVLIGAGLALVGGALLVLSSKVEGEEVTLFLDPDYGEAGTEVIVTGTGWEPLDPLTSVKIGEIIAQNTLTVDADGNLSGLIIVPLDLEPGVKDVTISGPMTGVKVFKDAFTIPGFSGEWELIASVDITVPAVSSTWTVFHSITLIVEKVPSTWTVLTEVNVSVPMILTTWSVLNTVNITVPYLVRTWTPLSTLNIAVPYEEAYVPPNFTLLELYAFPASVLRGQQLIVPAHLYYAGPAQRITLYLAVGIDGGAGFNELDVGQVQVDLPKCQTLTHLYMNSSCMINSSRTPGLYDVYVKIPGVISSIKYQDKINVQSSQATLTCSTTVYRGGNINFNFGNFNPGPVQVEVMGEAYSGTFTADSSGNGMGSLGPLNLYPTSYTLKASQSSSGKSVLAYFQVWQ